MNRAKILDNLQKAERHIAQGERHIARQKEIVSGLGKYGHDAAAARTLLVQFEELLVLHVTDRDRLRAELATGSPPLAALMP
jgi:hypothetical protein